MCVAQCYLTCTAICCIGRNYKKWSHKHRRVLRYVALSSSSLRLFHSLIHVCHLKQKREERQRLLHYLELTYTALATCTFVDEKNQCGK